MACGACHIAYDPLNPPEDPSHPAWENIKALVGNQYSRISNLLGSGLSPHRLEWQLIARARPGIVDTSALPMDFVSNPGTMNAIINFARRPLHENEVLKWRKASACAADGAAEACWCEPGRTASAGRGAHETEMVPSDPQGRRGFDRLPRGDPARLLQHRLLRGAVLDQPPDRPARADPSSATSARPRSTSASAAATAAPSARSRTGSTTSVAFFLTARPTDLWQARGLGSPAGPEVELDAEFFDGAVEQGRQVFAANCARCHSSQPGTPTAADFTATDPADPTLRLDWLGNDEVDPPPRSAPIRGRALHSNHMASRVWAEYASATEQYRPADPTARR